MAEYVTKSGIKLKGVIPPKSEDPEDFWKALNDAREFFRARPEFVEAVLNERRRQRRQVNSHFRVSNLLNAYKVALESPDSGFEVLELLDMRSQLVDFEERLTGDEKATLEEADEILLKNLKLFYEKIQKVGHLPKFRERARALPSHWWWYMDKFIDTRSPDGSKGC